ncbi:MAG: ABC transporter permease, partial [Bradyrhizobium sp.]
MLAASVSRAGSWRRHALVERYAPIVTIVLALIAVWYIAAVLMNLSLVRDGFDREETPYTLSELLKGTMSAERPLLPAPHQVMAAFVDSVFGYAPSAPRSLVYHSAVT